MIYDLVFIVVGIVTAYINGKEMMDLDLPISKVKDYFILACIALLAVWVCFVSFMIKLQNYLS